MRRLGEILIEHGSITAEQLQKALSKQKGEKDKRVGQILIELGFVTEEDIVVALATQYSYAYLPLEHFSINQDVCHLVSGELARKHSFIPIDKVGNILTITMADPSDDQAITEIAKATNCKVLAFVSTVSEIQNTIDKFFSPADESPDSHKKK